ncbi:protein phosphatase methylesterase [Microstroma glucosiphilum]|uniref:Protein phosphatase methylesterase 1 n=1 Tax=Pseudomicrostroma glucosiphilum TaxID=1684307 RepID=A0A316UCH2_9BASI|nr:protein phosphatase methylesterase [Pseudomicrostroma glucosiphilum]PWN20715.1 protein phosphatase methylesterase [Pseudomicrostroma glucosiphilum]
MAPPKLVPRKTNKGKENSIDYTPISAADCFEDAFQVELQGQGNWRVYLTPPKPIGPSGTRAPALSPKQGKTSATLPKATTAATASDPTLASLELPDVSSDEEEESQPSKTPTRDPGTLFFFHHGAGFSALSFALAAREVTRLTGGEAGVMALDCRGHGRTSHPASIPLPLDMSLERLTQDGVEVLHALYPEPGQMPTLVLVGHSMGGSIVTSLCAALQSLPTPVKVAGVAVLDVVEGTAMDALEGMKGIVLSHPKGFDSVAAGVKWHMDSGSIHNLDSARRSVPSLLVPNPSYSESTTSTQPIEDEAIEELAEEDDATVPHQSAADDSSSYPFIWRADLLATQQHWRGWFEGLSKRFLGARTARLLLLAGTDRLDKELMVGQMQGKYQLTVFPDVGHCLQEDAPEKTAKLLVDFWRRNEVTPGKLGIGLKRVGDA